MNGVSRRHHNAQKSPSLASRPPAAAATSIAVSAAAPPAAHPPSPSLLSPSRCGALLPLYPSCALFDGYPGAVELLLLVRDYLVDAASFASSTSTLAAEAEGCLKRAMFCDLSSCRSCWFIALEARSCSFMSLSSTTSSYRSCCMSSFARAGGASSCL